MDRLPSTAPHRIASLDLLRGAAAFGVALAHFVYVTTGSTTAEALSAICVELFFPLSGFVLASQLLLVSRDASAIRVFYLRRWLRTLPPYLVAMSAAAILFNGHPIEWLAHATFTQSIIPDIRDRSFYAIAWSLAVEEWFYLLMPVIMIAGARIRVTPLTAALAVIAIAQIAKVVAPGDHMRIFTPLRLDAIAAGFVAYVLLDQLRPLAKYFLPISAVGLLVATSEIISNPASHAWQFIFVDLATVAGTSAVILLSQRDLSQPAAAVADWFGRISYPVYLFHLLVLALLGPDVGVFKYVVVLTLFCTSFHVLFEIPLLKSRPVYLVSEGADLSSPSSQLTTEPPSRAPE
ncbi:MAG: acyltransferase [Pseudolabrys sp.]|nr:acyltransferase [Pseudolabrys sp.]